MTTSLARLRDAISRNSRQVEVGPNGEVREIKEPATSDRPTEQGTESTGKATRLAERTFG